MLIPNLVPANSDLTLAVPDPSYWCSTSAEYYINIPGYGTQQACVWGSSAQPIGNWAPFVAGANQAADGNTFVTAGINPIYCCEANAYTGVDPGFAIRIDCPSGNCNGMPCECNPATMGPNKCSGGSVGAGGAEFCVVTVPPGASAQLVIFSTSNGSSVTTAPVTNNAVSNPNIGSGALVPAPPAPAPSPAHPPKPASAPASSSAPAATSSSSTSCTTAEPSPVYQPDIWAQPVGLSSSDHTSSSSSSVTALVTALSHTHASTKTVYVGPSGDAVPHKQGFQSNNATTSTSVTSPTSPILKTSSTNRVTFTNLLSLLVVALAIFHL